MLRRFLVLGVPFFAVTLGLWTAPAVAADVAPVVAESGIATEPTLAEKPVYGPIYSKDPLVRAEIKHLYLELNRVGEETNTQLALLSERMSTETDADFRFEIQHEVAQLKESHLQSSMELNLEIARLNGDETRVADFELALDQLLNPEKYRSEVPAEARTQRPPPDAESRN